MIKKVLKTCTNCGRDCYYFSHKLCMNCWKRLYQKPIPKQSNKEKERLQKYYILRDEYLKNHPLCEVCNKEKSTQIHHRKGRLGNNLFNYFLAICDEDHKKVEMNPEWAYENNYSLLRN